MELIVYTDGIEDAETVTVFIASSEPVNDSKSLILTVKEQKSLQKILFRAAVRTEIVQQGETIAETTQ